MDKFFRFFAERHLLANLLTIMTILLGVFALSTIRRDIWPEVEYGMTMITTRHPGASPEDVELNVTNKLEEELKSVTGIERLTSVSMENISVITVILDPDANDHDEINRDIDDAVGRVTDFPIEVTESPAIVAVKTDVFPVVEVGLTGDVPYSELRELARLFEKKLENVEGVSSVRKYGYLAREVHIDVLPVVQDKYQIPMREIIGAIQRRNIRATGGSFESYTSEKNIVTLAQFDNPQQVKDVIVRTTFDGPSVRVKDLAIIEDGFEDERVLSRMNAKRAISFEVKKKGNADAIRTVDAVRELLERESLHLPDGVEFALSNDFSTYVRKRLDVVQTNGLIGLALVMLMLSIFLNLRAAFWVAMGIPVTLLGTIFLMPFFGSHLDSIALAAMIIVIGIIVDDGIIIAENIQRHREAGASPVQAAVDGIKEVFFPVLTTILTTFLAFAPMFFMSGIMGDFVFVIPLVITLSLFISLLEGVVALPAHLTAGRKNRENIVKKQSSWFKAVENTFNRGLQSLLRFRYIIVVLFIGALGSSLWYAYTSMTFELFPSSMADKVMMLAELPTGTSLQASADKMVSIEEIVGSLPDDELASYVTRIGTQEVWQASGYPPGENENWAYMVINLTPFSERDRVADEIVQELRDRTDSIEGFERITFAIEAGGPPVGRPITIRVVGTDDDMRITLADSVEAYLGSIEGVADISRNDAPGKDQVEIKIDYDKLSRLGLSVADIAQNVRTAYDGEIVTSVRYGDEDVDFRVQLSADARSDQSFVTHLNIPNRQGRLIPLSEVAHLETGPGPSNFYHLDNERAITITADIVTGVVTPLEATQKVSAHFDLENDWQGAQFIIGGEAEETDKSMTSLLKAFVIAIVAIYFLLVLLFNSPTQPLAVLSIIPFGIMGVIIAFALHKEPFGFVSMLGVIGLAGVVINDSLVLAVHINRLLKKRSSKTSMRDIVAQGTSDRLRAVLLTTLTTVVGLLPLAYGLGGHDPYMGPMALALGYGLLFATPITLLLMPSIYMIGDDLGRLFKRTA